MGDSSVVVALPSPACQLPGKNTAPAHEKPRSKEAPQELSHTAQHARAIGAVRPLRSLAQPPREPGTSQTTPWFEVPISVLMLLGPFIGSPKYNELNVRTIHCKTLVLVFRKNVHSSPSSVHPKRVTEKYIEKSE